MEERALPSINYAAGMRTARDWVPQSLGVVNWITVFGGVVLLSLSLWPGFVVGCWLILAYPLILALGLAWLVVVAIGTRRQPRPQRWLHRVLVAPVMVCMTYGLLRYYIPRRAAFAMCRPVFESHVATAPASVMPAPLGLWLGIYRVDQYGADPRGGVYFRTGTTADGIGPDALSYGFAYRPNPAGTPFGAARYHRYPMFGDWYWFQASDDWH